MAEQKIELRKVRDFSENINDTFLFIRQHFKPLMGSFLAIAGIFMLGNAIITGVYQAKMGGFYRNIFGGGTGAGFRVSVIGETYGLVMLTAWLNMTAMAVAITGYIKVYLEKGATPTIDEVWAQFRRYFFRILFYMVPVYLVMIIGMVFCLVPGIYLAVVLMPIVPVVMIEDETFGNAWSRCFTIIKENFWLSLGIYLVAYIIYFFATMIISTVAGVIAGLIALFTTKDIETTVGIITSILGIFSYVFYVVFFVAVVLHYFTLVEKYDSTGMLQRLNKLGEPGGDFRNIQEQY